MKRYKGFLVALALTAVMVSELVPAFSIGPVTIAVVLSRDIAPYREALQGFQDAVQRSRQQVRIVEFNLEVSGSDGAAFADRIRAKKPALILTLGSAATALTAERVRDIPIVFSLVLPSNGTSSLEEMRSKHGNMTGASMEIPLAFQFRKIREVLPGARRLGVLYDPAVSGPLVEAARAVAAELRLELVAMPVASENDVVREMEGVEGKVDVLWSVADSTVFSPQGLKHILLSTLRGRLPFVGLSPSFVKAGALLALSCDYEDVGRQSGELAARILQGEPPERIPTAVPREVSMSVNMNTARQIEVAISDAVKKVATLVF